MLDEKLYPDGIIFKVSGITENEKYVVVMFEQLFDSEDGDLAPDLPPSPPITSVV